MPNKPFVPQRTEGSQVPQEPQVEIPLSQSAPPCRGFWNCQLFYASTKANLEFANSSCTPNTPSFNLIKRHFRPKQRIFRAPTPFLNLAVPPAPHVGLATNPSNLDDISAETLAAASETTSSRLFKHIPTPGVKPPNQD
ncbi:hypothetical protein PIB30_076770 [Stylosanthes scabra]|uniref:Uncharacterized protein n=1 Tax=Stylosanthes scabra TaxID=79078 RepID=A0ABU6SQI3_9FABA|nr:hypothetical protein [Stylosanthes scabra]